MFARAGVRARLRLNEEQLDDLYYATLLRFVGCNAHAHDDAAESGDEVAYRAGVAPLLSGGAGEYMRFVLEHLGEGVPRRREPS